MNQIKCIGLAVFFSVAGSIEAREQQENDPKRNTSIRHVVIEAATAETPRSDTASIAELSNGRLMVVYHKYEQGKHSGHDQGRCTIWSKVSRDGGETWEGARMLVDVEPGDMNVQAPALLRLKSGLLLLTCLRAHQNGASSTMCLFSSNDEGETFSSLDPVWSESRGQWLQGGASNLTELKSGRLLLPAHGGSGNQWRQKNSAWCFISDDQGKTWQRSTLIDLPKRGAMEASVAELADGSLFMSLRTQLGGPYLSRSTDGGKTWTEAVFSGLEGGESCTCLRRIPGTKDIILFWNNSKYDKRHHHFGERTPLTVAISSDRGRSWQITGDLGEDPKAEYTNLDCFFTSKGNAVVTYMYAKPAWNRNQIHLRAALIPRTWFHQSPVASQAASDVGSALPVQNPGFESEAGGWNNLQVGDCQYYAPVEGKSYAVLERGARPARQQTAITLEGGKQYTVTVWSRSIYDGEHTQTLRRANFRYPRGNAARAVANVRLLVGGKVMAEVSKDVSPVALKGIPEKHGNDDGANVWLDGGYRVQFNGESHFYQLVSEDPIKDPWELCRVTYEAGMAPGVIHIPGQLKAIYGTRYVDNHDRPHSAITLHTFEGQPPNYVGKPHGFVLQHSGNENPWVIDAHLFYDNDTKRLWMTWGGHQIFVSELDPRTGKLIGNPTNTEFSTHPQGTHTRIMSFAGELSRPPNMPNDWQGDGWGSGYMEGAAIYKHGGYYYALGSYGHLGRNYTIRMGRSKSVVGPYVDKDGRELTKFYPDINAYGASFLLGNDSNHLVPGHPHIWQEEDRFFLGYDYRILLHPDREEMDYMGIRELYWANGWPTIWIPIKLTFTAPSELQGQELEIALSNSGQPSSVVAFDDLKVTKGSVE